MQTTIDPIARCVEAFAKLPGIGPKTAQRLTYHLLREPAETSRDLSEAIQEMKESVRFCSVCFNITDRDPCVICLDTRRDAATICVVEEPLDILALERSRAFKGKYHVLHGAIDPLHGVSVEDLKIPQLLRRLEGGTVAELILATNPNVEGDVTAGYLERQLRKDRPSLTITRIARGLPVGGDLEYADEVTLARALEGRRSL